ncbi:Uma2 family endonuclease [Halomicronema hongdechloris]|uniref:Uma2 family endonuclease n=1 Tax=Halomicronema hongdechloris TaxID=1209493 RepID=UPI0009CA44DB|nr:Uma2 family endonuclease [Halomicronema hongdechloris]
MQTPKTQITLEAFLASPASGTRCELIDGEIVPKVAPKRFHSKTQRALLRILEAWGEEKGEIGVEWAVQLKRNGRDWVPVPDVSFVYAERLPDDLGDQACPVPVDLAVEIISANQTFGIMAEKAVDYIMAGVARVWIVDPTAKTITVFKPNALPVTYRGSRHLTDEHLTHLTLTVRQLFAQAGLLGE